MEFVDVYGIVGTDMVEMITVLIILLSCVLGHEDNKSLRRKFIAISLELVLVILCDATSFMAEGVPMLRSLNIAAHTIMFCAIDGMCFTLMWYAEEALAPNDAMFVLHRRVAGCVCLVSVTSTILNIPFGYFFTVSANGVFTRGVGLTWANAPTMLILLVCAMEVVRLKDISVRHKIVFLIYCFLSGVSLIPAVLLPDLYTREYTLFVGYILLYSQIYIDQGIHIARRQLAATEQLLNAEEGRRRLMQSQIQPHFIFNALSSIHQICKDEQAADLLLDFSDYLRMNIDTLSNEVNIPFEKELKHTKAYVRIEQLRFGKKLTVIYDIGTTDFTIPPLTVQPIVENAVKHGICQKRGAGRVYIGVHKGEGFYEIIVKDDGAGFDVNKKPDDGRTHIGLENVADRLQYMCNGTVQIDSTPGVGTTVTMRIPIQITAPKKK